MSKSSNRYPVLENLFKSKIRIKVLKFLFRNYPVDIRVADLANRVQEPVRAVHKEIKELERIGLIKKG